MSSHALKKTGNVCSFRPWDENKSPKETAKKPNYVPTDSTHELPQIVTYPNHYSCTSLIEQTLLVHHASLLEDLLHNLQQLPNDQVLRQIIEHYTSNTSTLEQLRIQTLAMNSDNLYVHTYYNEQRLLLIEQTKSHLSMFINKKLTTGAPQIEGCRGTTAKVPDVISTDPPQPQDDSGYLSSPSSGSWKFCSPSDSYAAPAQGQRQVSNGTLSIVQTKAKRRHCNKPLDGRAVEVLNEWYAKHESNPYPTVQGISVLSKKSGLTHSQIRKWLANKRLRSRNTYKKTGRMNPLRYHTIERKKLDIELRNMTEKRNTHFHENCKT